LNTNFFTDKGMLGYPMAVDDSGFIEWDHLKGFALMPSVDFHRDPSQGIDSLIPRITSEFDIEDFVIEKQFIRVGFAYATDFSLDKRHPCSDCAAAQQKFL
jgi:hypothetical protein